MTVARDGDCLIVYGSSGVLCKHETQLGASSSSHLGRIIIMTVARDGDGIIVYSSSGVLYDQQTRQGT